MKSRYAAGTRRSGLAIGWAPAARPGRKIIIETSHARRGLAATLALLALLAGCTSRSNPRTDGPEQSAPTASDGLFTPSERNQDPSKNIEGVVVTDYEPAHSAPGQRVAYDKFPPYGGAHDRVWANCDGTVYSTAVRNEQMVHALEHGAVWIAYDPDAVAGPDLAGLAAKVDGQPYLMLSPYPGLDQPVSLQSWGHQLKLDSADDERIDQFIEALRDNPYTTPEAGAPCATQPSQFDVTDPPAFDPSPPGPGAMPVTGP
ncbi:MAG TPA: DUF3105 domain-containing protein [Actinophytocola sp.]|nr:DUF3105 domain-containing protein [Actinophytocola sp.]